MRPWKKRVEAYKNSLETFDCELFNIFAKSTWEENYYPEVVFQKTDDKYVLSFDECPIMVFSEGFAKGMNYSEKEKRYVDDVFYYSQKMYEAICATLKERGKIVTQDHHFQVDWFMSGLEDDIAFVLDENNNIRPEITNIRIEKMDDGSYFCTCDMNGQAMDTHYVNGTIVETTFEDCCYELEELKDEYSDQYIAILKKHFRFALFAMEWKLKKFIEQEKLAASR